MIHLTDFERVFGDTPGSIRTLAGFLGDAQRIPELRPITTRVRQLNPDLWPHLSGPTTKGE